MSMASRPFIRPVRIPTRVELCYAEPSAVRVGTKINCKLSFIFAQDVKEGTDLRILFYGGRNIKGVLNFADNTLPGAPNNVRVSKVDGTPIEVLSDESSEGEVALKVLPGGFYKGEVINAFFEATFPESALENKMFLLMIPKKTEDTGVPDVNATQIFDIIGTCLVHIIGNGLHRLCAWVPSQVQINQPFSILVRPEDKYGNLACEEAGSLKVSINGNEIKTSRKSVDGTTCCRLEGITIDTTGTYRLKVENRDSKIKIFTNPIRVRNSNQKQNHYWGYIHGHTEMSDGAGTVDNYFICLRDTCGLDFGALGDHDHLYETSEEMWHTSQEVTMHYNNPPEFVTFLGYEWAKWRRNGDGDRNVYYLEDNRPMYRSDDGHCFSPKSLFEALKNEKAIVIPHHTAASGNPCDFKDHDPDKERLIELYSMWGSSECSVHDWNSFPIVVSGKTDETDLDAGEVKTGFVQRALELGWRVGFTGGGDDHTGHPGVQKLENKEIWRYNPGLLAVRACENTREAIWDALWNRRTVATTGARIIIDFSVSNAVMGSELNLNDHPELTDTRTIKVEIHGTSELEIIEVVRNSQVVYSYEGNSQDASFEWVDTETFEDISLPPALYCDVPFIFYYLRIKQNDGEMAWASPVWILE